MTLRARLRALASLLLSTLLAAGLVRCSSHGSTSGADGGSRDGASAEAAVGKCSGSAGCIPPGAPSDYGLCCSGSCLDIQSDPENCGGCGLICPSGRTCHNGFCDPPSCAGAATADPCTLAGGGSGSCCDGVCQTTNALESDPANCGSCGNGCAAGGACKKGECELADGGSGSCTVDSDCASGQTCSSGECATKVCGGARPGTVCNLPATATDPQGICCAGDCLDSYWDNENCGGYGFTCPSGTECFNGTCQETPSCGASNWGSACQASPGVAGNCQ